MYFFDLGDYYNPGPDLENKWLNYGYINTTVGCMGGPFPADWEDYASTARATTDAFLKAVHEWYLASSAMGYTEPIDDGCSPSYADVYYQYIVDMIDFRVKRSELFDTINLYRYYYDWLVTVNAPNPSIAGGTYESYKEYCVDSLGSKTGTTTSSFSFYNPYTETTSATTVTYNYGTSFETNDLQTKVDDYETSMKSMMCSLKNMWSVMDGDTFDELAVDDNGNFLPNTGYTYNYI